jgi:hypothetical protein
VDFPHGMAREVGRRWKEEVRCDTSRRRRRDRVVRGFALRSKGARRAQRPEPVRASRRGVRRRRRLVPRGGSPQDDALVARPAGPSGVGTAELRAGELSARVGARQSVGEGSFSRLVRPGPRGRQRVSSRLDVRQDTPGRLQLEGSGFTATGSQADTRGFGGRASVRVFALRVVGGGSVRGVLCRISRIKC